MTGNKTQICSVGELERINISIAFGEYGFYIEESG
jgi:hypothetical protein